MFPTITDVDRQIKVLFSSYVIFAFNNYNCPGVRLSCLTIPLLSTLIMSLYKRNKTENHFK